MIQSHVGFPLIRSGTGRSARSLTQLARLDLSLYLHGCSCCCFCCCCCCCCCYHLDGFLVFRSRGSSGCSQAARRGTAKLASDLLSTNRERLRVSIVLKISMILIFSVVLVLEQPSPPPLLNIFPLFNSWPIYWRWFNLLVNIFPLANWLVVFDKINQLANFQPCRLISRWSRVAQRSDHQLIIRHPVDFLESID